MRIERSAVGTWGATWTATNVFTGPSAEIYLARNIGEYPSAPGRNRKLLDQIPMSFDIGAAGDSGFETMVHAYLAWRVNYSVDRSTIQLADSVLGFTGTGTWRLRESSDVKGPANTGDTDYQPTVKADRNSHRFSLTYYHLTLDDWTLERQGIRSDDETTTLVGIYDLTPDGKPWQPCPTDGGPLDGWYGDYAGSVILPNTTKFVDVFTHTADCPVDPIDMSHFHVQSAKWP